MIETQDYSQPCMPEAPDDLWVDEDYVEEEYDEDYDVDARVDEYILEHYEEMFGDDDE